MFERPTVTLRFVASIALLGACQTTEPPPPPPSEGGTAAENGTSNESAKAILRAEDRRRTADLPEGVLTSRDAVTRRLAVRALARIADERARTELLAALSDEDSDVVALAAYGLGFACKGAESATVRALAARAATWTTKKGERRYVSPEIAIARAVARCAAPESEAALAGWVRGAPSGRAEAPSGDGGIDDARPIAEAAALGLGDLASKKKALSDESLATLLAFGRRDDAARIAVLYPLGRVSKLGAATEGARELALLTLAKPDPGARAFAARLLGKTGPAGVAPLALLVDDANANDADAVEAARALGALGDDGKKAAAAALDKRIPGVDPFAIQKLAGKDYAVLSVLVAALATAPPKEARAVLARVAGLRAPGEPPPVLARRLADLRCEAAAILAREPDDPKLTECDVADGYARQKAELTVLGRHPIAGGKRTRWFQLTKSPHLRIRESAIELLTTHAELGDLGRAALRQALESDKGGLVATAADVLHTHPERALVLSARERRAGLDPRSPSPSTNPERETDRELERALGVALARAWKPDAFETRLALMDAAVAVSAPGARAQVKLACASTNGTVRERAAKAMRALGDTGACPPPATPDAPAPEVVQGARTGLTTLKLTTDTGELSIVLDPDLAPITSARIASLAKAGFYDGVVVHRVVPGFVAQFGDPDGDGYGGSGTPLRCETSPAAFEPFDVGMALAGRDTGSSQMFVTLARTPHLDGEYTRVGHATGDWSAIAQGDVIREVRVLDTATR